MMAYFIFRDPSLSKPGPGNEAVAFDHALCNAGVRGRYINMRICGSRHRRKGRGQLIRRKGADGGIRKTWP